VGELAPDIRGQRRDHPRVQPRDVRVERVDEDPEREVALELGCAAGEHGAAACVGALDQLGQQPCLADAGFTFERQRRDLAATERAERTVDDLEFGGTSDEGVVGDAGHARQAQGRA
jgi:hypothetical protein